MRKNESESVVKVFRDELMQTLFYVDASEHFLGKLENVADPEEKRKIIGGEFIRVFEEEARNWKELISWVREPFTRTSLKAVQRLQKW